MFGLARIGTVAAMAAAAAVIAAGCNTATPALHSSTGTATAPAASRTSAAASHSASAPGSRTMPSGLPGGPCALLRQAHPGQIKHVAEVAVSYQAMVNTGSDNNGCIADWDSGQQAISVRFAVGETRDSTLQQIHGSMKPWVQQWSTTNGFGLTDRFAVTSGHVLILVAAPRGTTAKPSDLAPVLSLVVAAYVHES
jgi:hypothetical protein